MIETPETVDVAVVGYGPVGMDGCAARATRTPRRRAGALPGLYNLPRPEMFDGETMRTFGALGVAEELLPNLKAAQLRL